MILSPAEKLRDSLIALKKNIAEYQDHEVFTISDSSDEEVHDDSRSTVGVRREELEVKNRILANWEALIERLSKTAEEDQGDVVDLRTLEIVVDKGHLDSLPEKTYEHIWHEDFDDEREVNMQYTAKYRRKALLKKRQAMVEKDNMMLLSPWPSDRLKDKALSRQRSQPVEEITELPTTPTKLGGEPSLPESNSRAATLRRLLAKRAQLYKQDKPVTRRQKDQHKSETVTPKEKDQQKTETMSEESPVQEITYKPRVISPRKTISRSSLKNEVFKDSEYRVQREPKTVPIDLEISPNETQILKDIVYRLEELDVSSNKQIKKKNLLNKFQNEMTLKQMAQQGQYNDSFVPIVTLSSTDDYDRDDTTRIEYIRPKLRQQWLPEVLEKNYKLEKANGVPVTDSIKEDHSPTRAGLDHQSNNSPNVKTGTTEYPIVLSDDSDNEIEEVNFEDTQTLHFHKLTPVKQRSNHMKKAYIPDDDPDESFHSILKKMSGSKPLPRKHNTPQKKLIGSSPASSPIMFTLSPPSRKRPPASTAPESPLRKRQSPVKLDRKNHMFLLDELLELKNYD